MPPGRPPCWRVDPQGRCHAAPYPAHGDLLRLLDGCHCDHVLHYPLDAPRDAYRFQCYVSLQRPGAVLVYTGGPRAPPPDAAELARVYRWALEHRAAHAYPCLRFARLRPRPNESLNDARTVAAWCDAHTDAFTRFRCKRLLQPAATSPPPPAAAAAAAPPAKRPRAA